MARKERATIIAVTSDDERHRSVVERAAAVASESGATVILFDLDADISPLESPLPTDWSGDGEQEQFGERLDPGDLEAAGQGTLADQVRVVRAAGVPAFGWLPPKADATALAEYAARQDARLVLISTEDADLLKELGSDRVRVASDDTSIPAEAGRLQVEAVPPA